MKFQLRRNTIAFWFASLGASATLAVAGAMVVLADANANPCLLAGQPQTQEWAAAHADQCDPGTGPNADTSNAAAPAAAPAATPTTAPSTAGETEAPATPATPAAADPAPAPPAAPADANQPVATPADQPAAAPAPADAAQPAAPAAPATPAAPAPAATPRHTTPVRVAAPKPEAVAPAPAPQPAPVRQTLVLPHVTLPTFQDARLFRESFTPKGRIPDSPQLDQARVDLMVAANQNTRVNWSVIAAMAWLDTRWDKAGAGTFVGTNLTTQQWRQFGVDGNADGLVQATSDADAVATVANFVASYEGKGGLGAALRTYYGDQMPKVRRATYLAAYYDALGSEAVAKGLDDQKSKDELTKRVLDDKRVTIYDAGRGDIQAGLIDPRVLVTVEFLANRFHTVGISSLISGHNVFTASGNVSLHSYGQAVDIASLDGEPIYGHQQADSNTVHALKDVLRMPESMQPKELISLWELGGASFALPDHDDHIHIGFVKQDPLAPAPGQ